MVKGAPAWWVGAFFTPRILDVTARPGMMRGSERTHMTALLDHPDDNTHPDTLEYQGALRRAGLPDSAILALPRATLLRVGALLLGQEQHLHAELLRTAQCAQSAADDLTIGAPSVNVASISGAAAIDHAFVLRGMREGVAAAFGSR